jgi:hypothetical protein
MSSISKEFVLIGPHAGKTMAVNGHEFIEGRYTYSGSEHQVATLARVFSFYGAVPTEQAELEALRAAAAKPASPPPVPGGKVDPPAGDPPVVGSTTNDKDVPADPAKPTLAEAIGMLDPEVDPPAGDPPVVGSTTNDKDVPADPAKPTLAEAIGMLDPEVDSHWTSNNLPGLDDLERLTGKKHTRADVDAIADGYTRAKARAAKQK